MGILQEILKTLSLPEFYFAMFRSATPVLLTTLGAMISSRSGTSNIALEGTMLISAFVGVVVSAFSQSAWIGFLGAVLAEAHTHKRVPRPRRFKPSRRCSLYRWRDGSCSA